MVDLNLATNKELIDELTNRNNFVGAVIYSMDEHKVSDQKHDAFGIATRCGDKESTIQLLSQMTRSLSNNTD